MKTQQHRRRNETKRKTILCNFTKNETQHTHTHSGPSHIDTHLGNRGAKELRQSQPQLQSSQPTFAIEVSLFLQRDSDYK